MTKEKFQAVPKTGPLFSLRFPGKRPVFPGKRFSKFKSRLKITAAKIF